LQIPGSIFVNTQITDFAKVYGQYIATEFTLNSAEGNLDTAGLRAQLYLVLGNGNWIGSETYNNASVLASVVVNGNNGTASTQPIRALESVLIPYLNTILLDDFRHYDVKQPDATGAPSGNIVNNIYGIKIADQKNAPGFTITNAWGIFQQGANDLNYFAGALGMGIQPSGVYPLEINGTINFVGTPAVFAGSLSGLYLSIYIGGVEYKLQLFNP
jgi:hypothetical protein